MESVVYLCGWVFFTALAAGTVAFAGTSIHERRWKPLWRGLGIFLPLLVVLALLLTVEYSARPRVVLTITLLGAAGVLALVLPLEKPPRLRIVDKQERVDERDAIFHRFYRLRPGTPEFDTYYASHPEKREFDDKVRSLPQLASPGCRCYDPITSPFQMALADVLHRITREIEWQPEALDGTPIKASAEHITQRVKGFARYLGADLVGTTKLSAPYVYSHIGRSPGPWGEPIQLDHTHAVAIAVGMSHDMVRHGPDGAITTETTLKYFEVGTIAMIVARYIHFLGYEARAHVDGNYRVMCGPIAVDAGLGELGRLGLLITPKFGPRVRLGVVTTTLSLLQDHPVHFGVQHFCKICKKCAVCCPSASVDSGDKGIHNGVEKWRTDQDACYGFWRSQGSDCGICMKVCPYSHPSTPLHNLVRSAVRRNSLARHVARWADDLFYGRRPTDRYPLPKWHEPSRQD